MREAVARAREWVAEWWARGGRIPVEGDEEDEEEDGRGEGAGGDDEDEVEDEDDEEAKGRL